MDRRQLKKAKSGTGHTEAPVLMVATSPDNEPTACQEVVVVGQDGMFQTRRRPRRHVPDRRRRQQRFLGVVGRPSLIWNAVTVTCWRYSGGSALLKVRIHEITGCVKPTRCSRLYNQLYNQLYNWLYNGLESVERDD